MATDLMHHPRQCTAMSKRSGARCGKFAMHGQSVCHIHGGKSLKGIAAPNYRTGKHSKYLRTDLLEKYDEIGSDPELLNLTDHIALLQVRQSELIERLEPYDSEAAWKRVEDAWERMRRMLDSKDKELRRSAEWAMTEAIEMGADDWEAWDGIIKITESIRKSSESEQKRRVAMGALLTIDDAVLQYNVLMDAIHSHVNDPAVLAAISEDFARNVGRASGAGAKAR